MRETSAVSIHAAGFNYLGEELYLFLMHYGYLYSTVFSILIYVTLRRGRR